MLLSVCWQIVKWHNKSQSASRELSGTLLLSWPGLLTPAMHVRPCIYANLQLVMHTRLETQAAWAAQHSSK